MSLYYDQLAVLVVKSDVASPIFMEFKYTQSACEWMAQRKLSDEARLGIYECMQRCPDVPTLYYVVPEDMHINEWLSRMIVNPKMIETLRRLHLPMMYAPDYQDLIDQHHQFQFVQANDMRVFLRVSSDIHSLHGPIEYRSTNTTKETA